MASRTSSSRARPIPDLLGAATNVPPLTAPMLIKGGVLWIRTGEAGGGPCGLRVAPHLAPREQVELVWDGLVPHLQLTFYLFWVLCSAATHGKLDTEWFPKAMRVVTATTPLQRGDAVLCAAVSFCKYATTCPTWRSAKHFVGVLCGDDTVVEAACKKIMQVCDDATKYPNSKYAERMATGAAIAFATSRLVDYQPTTEEQWTALFAACFHARAFSTQLPTPATGDDAHALAAKQCASAVMTLMSSGNTYKFAIEVM